MILYLSIIFFAMILIISFNILFNLQKFGLTPTYVVLGVILAVIFSILIDSLVALATRFIPEEKFNPFNKYFKGKKWEKKFYEKLNIRKWKDMIPELGKSLKYFDKTKVESKPTPEYYIKFLRETCIAEVLHLTIIPFTFVLAFIFPLKYFWCISFPVILVNIFLQILPICVQRYNRPKLIKAYERLLKYQKPQEVDAIASTKVESATKVEKEEVKEEKPAKKAETKKQNVKTEEAKAVKAKKESKTKKSSDENI